MKETDQKEYKQLMTAEEAARIKEYMKSVVDYGTASVLSGQSYTAAGKTGTAEYSSDKEKTTPGSSVCRMWKIRNWL